LIRFMPPRRYVVLQALLGANAQQMQRLCRHWPNLLARDPDQLVNNLATLSQRLQIPLEELKAMVLDEPGLLNYNVSTLTNRILDVTSVSPGQAWGRDACALGCLQTGQGLTARAVV
jgi:hypothetical protein